MNIFQQIFVWINLSYVKLKYSSKENQLDQFYNWHDVQIKTQYVPSGITTLLRHQTIKHFNEGKTSNEFITLDGLSY